MSKQYLAQHTIDDAHATDIFSVVATATQILSVSGSSSIKIHDSTSNDVPCVQTLQSVHPIGAHHIVISANCTVAASVGFNGEARIWRLEDGLWKASGEIIAARKKAGELWAVALSVDGRYLAGTTSDGRINVWDLDNCSTGTDAEPSKIAEWETKGSFGMAIDLSADNKYTATAHETGAIYLFSTTTARLLHSLPSMVKSIRALKFSPGSTLLAAAGDSLVISLYDPNSGEQVAQLSGHAAWVTSLDWSFTGQYLLSGSLDGKVKVWDVERRVCVATHSESDNKAIWSVCWLKKGESSNQRYKSERFVTAGGGGTLALYREATGQ